MNVRHKVTKTLGYSSDFNIHSLNEIVVGFEDMTSDYLTNYDVLIDDVWMDFQTALKEHKLIVDNYNTRFFVPTTEEDRIHGYAL